MGNKEYKGWLLLAAIVAVIVFAIVIMFMIWLARI
jgi:heme/copper-type cytochrome/quinol oxidase subunit 4